MNAARSVSPCKNERETTRAARRQNSAIVYMFRTDLFPYDNMYCCELSSESLIVEQVYCGQRTWLVYRVIATGTVATGVNPMILRVTNYE